MRIILAWLFLLTSLHASIELIINNRPAQLAEATVDARLHGFFLIRDLRLVFQNEGQRAAEGDLRCPLEEGEQVVSFAMDVNGLRRDAVVVPAKRARHAYETIVARGVDPGLLEVDAAEKEFRTRIFPIPARGGKTVWIRTIRFLKGGKVRVWPKGMGEPRRWALQIETKGGTAGEFQARQVGDARTRPQGEVVWEPNEAVAYRSQQGDLHLARNTGNSLPVGLLEVWLDGAAAVDPAALETLRKLLRKFGEAKVTLRIFRQEVTHQGEFPLRKGASADLMKEVGEEPQWGMARPEILPWQTVRADAVVWVTDGDFVFGEKGVGTTTCPLHVVDAGGGKSRWLRGRALASGGGWHGAGELDARMGVRVSGAEILGEACGEIFYLKGEGQGLPSPVADWLWAKLKRDQMKNEGKDRKRIEAFNLKHGVMDEDSAMVVLETARQYLEFGITPPESDEALSARWKALRDNSQQRRVRHLDGLVDAWRERCDQLAKPLAPLGERLNRQAEGRSKELSELRGLEPEVVRKLVLPLQNKLTEISALAENGIEETEVVSLKSLLSESQELEKEMRGKIPVIQVTVAGQVRKPGQLTLNTGSSLRGAIQAAGGETPFGAMNRVNLYRQGRVYQFDLRRAAHQKVRLFSRDVVEVPGKRFFGNGGSGKAGMAPFSDQSSAKIVFERGAGHLPKYYLDDLQTKLGDDVRWWMHYRAYRAACGWRADFYLNVIEFLRERKEIEKGLRVATELAESMPSNAEILRRAALACRRLGAVPLSRELFVRVGELDPESAVALSDLARTEEILGHHEEALKLYWRAVQKADSRHTSGRALVALEDMNALISREKLNAEEFGIDPRLVRHVPVELRVVLRWDAETSHFDLRVRKPIRRVALRGTCPNDDGVEWWSENLSLGSGPESWSASGLLPGEYEIGARFSGDRNRDGKSTATVEVEVIRHFGEANETRETHALRVEEKTDPVIVRAKVYPAGWE